MCGLRGNSRLAVTVRTVETTAQTSGLDPRDIGRLVTVVTTLKYRERGLDLVNDVIASFLAAAPPGMIYWP